MTITNTIFSIFTLFAISCSSTGKTVNENAKSDDVAVLDSSDKSMMEAGFLKGTVIYSEKEGDCPYTIDLESEDYNYLLDPINLEEKYKKDGASVWVKFGGLRMANRCVKANPVSITEIRMHKE